MAQKLIDIYNHILKYNDKEVYIAFHTQTNEPYFNAKQLSEMLEYSDYHDAIKQHVDKKDIFYLKDIVTNYKSLYKNVQGHSKFLSEGGLYVIILKSKKKIAREIFDWITHEVMPSLRKYGKYKSTNKIKHKIDKLNKIIKEKNDEISILKHNLKKPKIREGTLVYVLRTIHDNIEFDANETIKIKFGKSKKFKIRKPVYDTGNENRVQILKTIKVFNPENIERCVKTKMEKYATMKNKEFYECSYNQIINIIAKCVKFYEEKTINKSADVDKLSRQKIEDFNKDKKIMVKILSDDEFDKLFSNNNVIKNINTGIDAEIDANTDTDADTYADTDDLLSSDTDSVDNEIEDSVNQIGGGDLLNLKYISMKQKYLTLKYELL